MKVERSTAGIKENTNTPRRATAALHAQPGSHIISTIVTAPRRPSRKSQKNKRSPTYELEWWNKNPKRLRVYVKHFQQINTSSVKKFEPPRDYGDVVTATNAQMVYPRRRRT